MFTIDGITWPVPCQIERVSEVRPSQISGLLLDKSWFNDVIGTYMSYTVALAVPLDLRDRYSELYEALTAPVDGHTFTLPYDQGALTVTGRVRDVTDRYVRLANGGTIWKGPRFTIVSNHPSRQMSLGETLARGRSPLPELAAVQVGDIYTCTPTGWQKTNYPNADDIPY